MLSRSKPNIDRPRMRSLMPVESNIIIMSIYVPEAYLLLHCFPLVEYNIGVSVSLSGEKCASWTHADSA